MGSRYIHHFHNHGHCNFGAGLDSISFIEQLRNNIKSIIISIYYVIPGKNFILFLRESEWRNNQNKFNNKSLFQSFEETAI